MAAMESGGAACVGSCDHESCSGGEGNPTLDLWSSVMLKPANLVLELGIHGCAFSTPFASGKAAALGIGYMAPYQMKKAGCCG
mmetsp:Transcript_44968/g.97678  ORF Transcript_44968/g.97678 Transcript_44968/m.97678 type:complete len:83 (-) Transcript_44968:15-263(-)